MTLPSGALKPTFEFPNIPDIIVASTSARVGASIYPERDQGHEFKILTPFNAILPVDVFADLLEKQQREGTKQQMTFRHFAEWISLRPKDIFIGYVSAILMEIDLAGLYSRGELFCIPCHCGNVVFSHNRYSACKACPREYETRSGSGP